MVVRFGICAGWPSAAALTTPQRRRIAEIELAIVQFCHARQALTQCIDANDVRIHLTHSHCQGIDLFLEDALDVLDLRLLPEQISGPIAQLIDGATPSMPGSQAHTHRKSTAHNGQHHSYRRRHNHGMAQVKLLHPARLTADKNDIHEGYASNAVIVLYTGALCPTLNWEYAARWTGRLCRKLTQNKDFRTVFPCRSTPLSRMSMQNPKSLSDLLSGPGKRLTALKSRSQERSLVLEYVRVALPARLALAVVSAGIDQGRLTIGVVGAVWASRIRYFTEALRKHVGDSTGAQILGVRIRVIPPSS